jgi:hypothetical protein
MLPEAPSQHSCAPTFLLGLAPRHENPYASDDSEGEKMLSA